jgi:hypothetical protein
MNIQSHPILAPNHSLQIVAPIIMPIMNSIFWACERS